MSGVRKGDEEILAIICGDLHLSHTPPAYRANEPNWYQTQANYLYQLNDIIEDNKIDDRYENQIPIICAGDVFDRWNNPIEFINHVIHCMPHMYAIPGQHDMPNHRYDELERSSYCNLIYANVLWNMRYKEPTEYGKLRIHAFPYGMEIKTLPPQPDRGMLLEVAVIHSYIWKKDCGYQDAPKEKRVGSHLKKLKGYDVAIFGDNHIPFEYQPEDSQYPFIYNCGSFMRRKSDEKYHKPSVGLLTSSGKVIRKYLDISKDVTDDSMCNKNKKGKNTESNEKLMQYLHELGDIALDFKDIVSRMLKDDKIMPDVIDAVSEALETKKLVK